MKEVIFKDLEIGYYFNYEGAIFKVEKYEDEQTGILSLLVPNNAFTDRNDIYECNRLAQDKIQKLNASEVKLYRLIS